MKSTILTSFCLALQLWLCGQSSIGIIPDLTYYAGPGATTKHRLDLYIPSTPNPPLILWIHGGAWSFGDRKNEAALAKAFAEEGIAIATISYRLSPALWADPKFDKGIQHPEHIRDVARAFQFLHEHADNYGYAKSQIFISGYSAGGYLSALLAVDPQYLTEVGHKITDLKAAIPIAAAYDLEHYYEAIVNYRGARFTDQHVKGVFGVTPEKASITALLNESKVPMLVISESETFAYTLVLERAVQAQNIRNVKFEHFHNEDHQSLALRLSENESNVRSEIIDYLKRLIDLGITTQTTIPRK